MINIAKLLEDAPEGTKLYSPICGDVELIGIDYSEDNNPYYPIQCEDTEGDDWSFSEYGIYSGKGECLLFPSKDNRDWSTFKVEKHYDFKPFDKVLVRDGNGVWQAEILSRAYYEDGWVYECCGNLVFFQCVPYEGNEHLLGTTNKP